jgi:bifunctional non-homologous end joining protein LigD
MKLSGYIKKRSFRDTPEPKAKIKASENDLIFVVQKHKATHLHYDFRLEIKGVLVSWAIPKGPSMNPIDKRLAVMVEDHPYDYKDFEGNIPEENYGAGNVIVWDNGTYQALHSVTKSESEKYMKDGLINGSLKFILHGRKLKGEFALVKLKTSKNESWLLIKKRDVYASEEDILKKDKSVISNYTIEKLEKKYPKTSTDNLSTFKFNGKKYQNPVLPMLTKK